MLILKWVRNSEWQREYEISSIKLRYIKPLKKKWESARNNCKKYEVILSRLGIRHAGLTYGQFMSRKDQ